MKYTEKTERKPKFRLPFSAVLLYIVLIAAAVSGVTFSRYVTGTTVGDAARVAIMRDITVTETGNFAEPDKWIITPGVDMIKNAVVNFEGSEMACYVFCEIKAKGWSRLDEQDVYKRQFLIVKKSLQHTVQTVLSVGAVVGKNFF